jgi:hypothetical protein
MPDPGVEAELPTKMVNHNSMVFHHRSAFRSRVADYTKLNPGPSDGFTAEVTKMKLASLHQLLSSRSMKDGSQPFCDACLLANRMSKGFRKSPSSN